MKLILCTRPLAHPHSHEFALALVKNQIKLKVLSQEDTALVLKHHLRAEVSPVLVDIIQKKTNGNPFFSRELASMLKEQGHIATVDSVAVLQTELSKIVVPDTIQKVILARIDRLELGLQQLLKSASILGNVFEVSALRHLDEHQVITMDLEQSINLLEQNQLVICLNSLKSMFYHVLIQDVAYSMMTVAQRRKLHTRILSYLTAPGLEPLLIFHLERAIDEENPDQILVEKLVDCSFNQGTFRILQVTKSPQIVQAWNFRNCSNFWGKSS